jgi:hypothetical protein
MKAAVLPSQLTLNATYFATNALASGPSLHLEASIPFAPGTRWHSHIGRNERSAATAPNYPASRLGSRNSAALVTAYNSESKLH